MIEITAKEAVFHFNKKSISDATIPPWILKTRGESWYVSHVTCEVPWSTKETPTNSHTQAAIKLKNVYVQITDDNEAIIQSLTKEIKQRVMDKQARKIKIGWQSTWNAQVQPYLTHVHHENLRSVESRGCSADWLVCEIYSEDDWAQINLTLYPRVRRFMPNEWQYQDHDVALKSAPESD